MSGRIVGDVCDHSRSKGCDRNVLFALAEAAHRDGVSWLPIDAPRHKPEECITHAAKCSRRQAIRSIQSLVELGELEVRKARRGRARINVYRVVVGAIAVSDVDYSRLPFALDRPFGLGANLAPSQEGDQVPNPTATGCHPEQRPGAKSDRDWVPSATQRAREDSVFDAEPSKDPSGEPSLEPSAAEQSEGPTEAQVQEDDRNPAAAPPGEPARLVEVVAALESFRGRDIASLRVVEPLALQMPAGRFQELVETARRRPADNDVGLLVHLLKIEAAEQRAKHSAASIAVGVESESLSERRRRDPESYVRRLMAWPNPAPPDLLETFLGDYLEDEAERGRLLALAAELRAEPAGAMFERWIREVSPEHEHEHVRQELDAWCDERGFDHIERGRLQELAEEARQAPGLAAVEEAA